MLEQLTAILLAGGLGTRLRSVVPDLPKPLAPVAGKPFITYLLDNLIQQGVKEIVLSVGYKHEAFSEQLGSTYRGIPLNYSIESSPMGTGGAIKQAMAITNTKSAMVLNGDTFLDIDYGAFYSAFRQSGSLVGMCIRHVEDTMRYGRCEIEDGVVLGFGEKGFGGSGYINAGIYLIDRNIFCAFPSPNGAFSFEAEFLVPFAQGLRPMAFDCDGYFVDIGIPEDYNKANVQFATLPCFKEPL